MAACRSCRSEIAPDATKCPHCLSWQTRVFPDPQSPRGIALLMAPFLAISAFAIFSIPGFTSATPDLGDFSIQESTLHYSETPRGDRHLAIVGRLHNAGDQPAKSPHFEARFFDADGNLIDSLASDAYDLVIAPGSEASFRIRGKAHHPQAAYHRHEVRLTAVHPPRSW